MWFKGPPQWPIDGKHAKRKRCLICWCKAFMSSLSTLHGPESNRYCNTKADHSYYPSVCSHSTNSDGSGNILDGIVNLANRGYQLENAQATTSSWLTLNVATTSSVSVFSGGCCKRTIEPRTIASQFVTTGSHMYSRFAWQLFTPIQSTQWVPLDQSSAWIPRVT